MTPILCDSTKSLAELVNDVSNGIGRLTDATSAVVTEERNGSYYLEITYPASGRLFSYIRTGGIIKARPNPYANPQLFRIAKLTATINGQIQILAYHVGYDLARAVVFPFSASSASEAVSLLKQSAVGGAAFTFFTDIASDTAFSVSDVESVRTAIGGSGGLVETYDGELEWDGLSVKLLKSRGSDRGVVIAYGKNLTDVKQEQILDEMYTTIVPYYKGGEGIIRGTDTVLAQASEDNMRVLALDVSPYLDTASGGTPDKNDIDAACAYYVQNHPELTVPAVSIDVKFQPLRRATERISLCDTVTVRYEKIGVSAKAKVTKTVYDVLSDAYTNVSLGQPKRTITDTIVSVSTLADIAKTTAEKAQETADSCSGSSGAGGSNSLTWGTSKKIKLDTNSENTGAAFTGDGVLEMGLSDTAGKSTVKASASQAKGANMAISNSYGEYGFKVSHALSAANGGYVMLYAANPTDGKMKQVAKLSVGNSGSTGLVNAIAAGISIGYGLGTTSTGMRINSAEGAFEAEAANKLTLSAIKTIKINGSTDKAYIEINNSTGIINIHAERINIHAPSGVYVNGIKIQEE